MAAALACAHAVAAFSGKMTGLWGWACMQICGVTCTAWLGAACCKTLAPAQHSFDLPAGCLASIPVPQDLVAAAAQHPPTCAQLRQLSMLDVLAGRYMHLNQQQQQQQCSQHQHLYQQAAGQGPGLVSA